MFYISTMYRWGCQENHSYVFGLFVSIEYAIKKTQEEEISRGGKYQGEIIEVVTNDPLEYDHKAFDIVYGKIKLNCDKCDSKRCIVRETIQKRKKKEK